MHRCNDRVTTVLSAEKYENMKSVDRTAAIFRRRFTGLPSEKWIAHLDSLELDRARKHNWTPKQFYYGLRITLQGKATVIGTLAMERVRAGPGLVRELRAVVVGGPNLRTLFNWKRTFAITIITQSWRG